MSKPRKKLTFKQKAFVKEIVKNKGNGTQAALQVYDTTKNTVACAIASENLTKPLIRREIEKQFTKESISIEYYLSNLNEYITAAKTSQDSTSKQCAIASLKMVGDFLARMPQGVVEPSQFLCSVVGICPHCGKDISVIPQSLIVDAPSPIVGDSVEKIDSRIEAIDTNKTQDSSNSNTLSVVTGQDGGSGAVVVPC